MSYRQTFMLKFDTKLLVRWTGEKVMLPLWRTSGRPRSTTAAPAAPTAISAILFLSRSTARLKETPNPRMPEFHNWGVLNINFLCYTAIFNGENMIVTLAWIICAGCVPGPALAPV